MACTASGCETSACTATPATPVTPALWLVQDGDTRMYIFGTVHALPPGVPWFSKPVVAALDGSDRMILEVPLPEDPMAMLALTIRLGRAGAPRPLAERVPPEWRPALESAIAELKPGQLEGYESWYLALTLANLQALANGFQTALGAESVLAERARPFRHLRVFRYQRDVDVRAVPFTKGLAVAELARHLGIDRAQILAIGDGHNDISMLDPSIAGMTGCPLNATPEIVEQVHAVGGHIARTPSLEGVIEIFDAYRAGKVCSDLPPQWIPASETEHPAALRPAHKKRGRRDWRRLRKPLLLAACLYTVYVVIAIFFEKMPFNKAIRGRYDRIAAAIWNALSPRDAAPPR